MALGKKTLLILVTVFLFHILVNSYILNKSKIIKEADDADRIFEGLWLHQELVNKEYKRVGADFLALSQHPKFFPLVEGLTLTYLEKIGLKDINWTILFSNAFFLFILLISVFKIGSILYNKEVGLLAAILLSFSPGIFSHSRVSMLDFPLAAMISLSFLSLLKTKNFSFLFFSLLTGILFSLAQFTKEAAIIFILPPFLYYSFKSLRIKEKRKQRIINFSITSLLFLILVGVVYLNPSNKGVFKTYWGKSFLIHNRAYDILYYIKKVPLLYLGIIFSIVLSPLVLSYIVNIRKRNHFLAIWLFSPLLIFSISPSKTARFLIPILPSLFIVLASEVFSPFFLWYRKVYSRYHCENRRKLLPKAIFLKIRKIYIGVLIFISCFQYAIFNFFPKFALYPSSPSELKSLYHCDFEIGLLSVRRDKDFYLVKKLINAFEKEKTIPNKKNKVIFTFRLGMEGALKYEFKIRNMPFFVDCPQAAHEVDAPPPGRIDWKEYLLTADYVVDKTGNLGWRGHLEDIGGEFKKSLKENAHFFKEVATFKNSNGDSIFVYKNIKKLVILLNN